MMPFSRLRPRRPRVALRFAFAVALAALSGCQPGRSQPAERGAARLIMSPNGEPLAGGRLGAKTCREAMTGWFGRLAHDDRVTREAFIADARRQFASMDLDRDGVVTPEELERFRAPFRPDPGRTTGNPATTGGRTPSVMPGPGRSPRGDAAPERPDPVMSADVTLRFKVDEAAFLAHADRVFAALSRGGAGGLALADAVAWCDDAPRR